MAPEKHEESPYWLTPDDEERARLNSQHQVLVQIADNKILHAPVDPSTLIRIADVGTGTGIWLNALSTHLNSTPTITGQKRQFDGFDMSPASFPAPGTHPENFRYSVYNILEPVPEELRGRYDLVHVRLLVAALGKGDVDTAVRNLVLLLRPGGWIQWEDLDSYTWAGRVPSSHVKEMHALMRSHMEARGMEEHIPSAFVAAATAHQDLQNVSARAFNTLEGGTQHRDAFNKAFLWSCARSSKMILRARGEENVEAEATRLDEGARRDIERDGIFWDSDEHVLLAQRR